MNVASIFDVMPGNTGDETEIVVAAVRTVNEAVAFTGAVALVEVAVIS